MNGTVTLRVDEVSEAVLVPLAALMSDRGGNYVLLKGEGSQSPGIKTYIDVGLSDANFAAVLEGLQENDVVLVRGEQMPDQTRRNVPSFMNPGGGQRR